MTEEKKIQFRVYYDKIGRILHYSMEDLAGEWIEVTPEQYSEMRMDVLVQDGKLVSTHNKRDIYKLAPSPTQKSTDDTLCSKYDVNIIIHNGDYIESDAQYWTQIKYEVSR
jgi:hypothetical protein